MPKTSRNEPISARIVKRSGLTPVLASMARSTRSALRPKRSSPSASTGRPMRPKLERIGASHWPWAWAEIRLPTATRIPWVARCSKPSTFW